MLFLSQKINTLIDLTERERDWSERDSTRVGEGANGEGETERGG